MLLVGALDNGDNLLTTLNDRFLGFGRLGDLVLQQIRSRQWVVTTNWKDGQHRNAGVEGRVTLAVCLRERERDDAPLQSSESALLPTLLFSMKN